MKKIFLHTTTKVSNKDAVIKVADPIFSLTNQGEVPVIINNNYRLMPFHSLGFDLSTIVGKLMHKGYTVKLNTQYSVQFVPLRYYLTYNPIIDALIILWYILNTRLAFKTTTVTWE